MTKKIVFFDIDGTLLNDKKELCQTTAQSIQTLQDKGVHVALATGRPPFMFEKLRKTLNIDTYIGYTGSYVVCEDKLIYQNTMEAKDIVKLHEDAMKEDAPIMLMGESYMQVTVDNHPSVQNIMDRLQFGYPNIDLVVPSEPVYQVLLFKQVEEAYTKLFPDFRFLQWSPLVSDVLPASSSKADGIKRVIDKLGIDIENTYAFGDGLNDLDMIETAGTSIVMDNGVDELKELADYVTDSVDNSGVKKGLEKFGLI